MISQNEPGRPPSAHDSGGVDLGRVWTSGARLGEEQLARCSDLADENDRGRFGLARA